MKTKLMFDLNRNAKGEVERYKASFVAKGFLQIYGVDFTDVFCSCCKFLNNSDIDWQYILAGKDIKLM